MWVVREMGDSGEGEEKGAEAAVSDLPTVPHPRRFLLGSDREGDLGGFGAGAVELEKEGESEGELGGLRAY